MSLNKTFRKTKPFDDKYICSHREKELVTLTWHAPECESTQTWLKKKHYSSMYVTLKLKMDQKDLSHKLRAEHLKQDLNKL